MIKNALLSLLVMAVAHTSNVVTAEAEVAAEAQVTQGLKSGGSTGLDIASVAVDLFPHILDLFKNKKKCRQVACWISTPYCYKWAADFVQDNIFKGRDGYVIESADGKGAWVRYWRVRTGVEQSHTIATGKCANGAAFSVSNCQSTGKVHC
ncbi:hypothetical protein FI667_g12318, partial [Globisporangium splendens]